jgi:hypothetical protein
MRKEKKNSGEGEGFIVQSREGRGERGEPGKGRGVRTRRGQRLRIFLNKFSDEKTLTLTSD